MQPWGSGVLQGEPFSFAAAKNGIGRGPRRRYDHCRRNYSPLQQRKLESDADLIAATTTAGETILLCSNKNLSRSRNIAAANDRSRRNHPPLQQRKFESVAADRFSNGRRAGHSSSPRRWPCSDSFLNQQIIFLSSGYADL